MFSPECLEISPGGLPHSGIPGLTFALNYPRLIAEFYALHRLLVPRHPPCALCSLTHLSTLLNADGRRVAAIVLRNGSLRVFCLVTLNHFLRYSFLKVHIAALAFGRRTPGPRRLEHMEMTRFELATPCLQSRCSPN